MEHSNHANSYSASNPDPVTAAARGCRTLINTLYRRAEIEPNKTFGSFPLANKIEDGFRDFTFAELASAVDVCAWHLKETFGTSDNFEPILYMGANDFRYALVFFAAIKCGFHALFVNPRYAIEGIMVVIEKMHCFKALYSSEERTVIEDIQSRRPCFKSSELAPFPNWLDADRKPFPFNKTSEESMNDPVLSVHSSGTTGLPKPITYKNGFFTTSDVPWPIPPGRRSVHNMEAVEGCQLAFCIYPMAHSGGFALNTLRPTITSCASVMLPSTADYTKSAVLTLELLEHKSVESIATTPLLLESICQLPGGLDALRKLHSIVLGGGPLRHDVAETIAANGIFVANIYGATELGVIPGLDVDAEDHEYLQFNPEFKTIFEPVDDEAGSYELVIRKGDGPEEEELHKKRGIAWCLDVDEWRSKDLFLPHPTKPDLWKYYGRTDDILVLAHAGKINPIPLEDAVCAHPGVSGAFVTGEYRFPPCILIEPTEKVIDREQFVEEIWPQIEKANAKIRKEMQIPRDLVAVLEERGLARGIKGQIVRKTNVQKHGHLIDKLYTEREKRGRSSG